MKNIYNINQCSTKILMLKIIINQALNVYGIIIIIILIILKKIYIFNFKLRYLRLCLNGIIFPNIEMSEN